MNAGDPRLDALLRSYAVPSPSADLGTRVLAAAAPVLAGYAVVAPNWKLVGRAVLVALLALPSMLGVDAVLLQGLYRLLSLVLPQTVSVALTLQYALGLLLSFGATFVMIPVVAGQVPARVEDAHV